MVAHNKAFGASCLENTGPLLAHLDTVSVARDLDAIRAALGDEKLNYLGLSYGSMIGAQYAELFPDKIRVMALDGALDHSQSENTSQFVEAKPTNWSLSTLRPGVVQTRSARSMAKMC